MTDAGLARIRDLIQQDVAGRGLRTDPTANLVTACPDDFAAACRSLAATPNASVAVVTGFLIPHAEPPAGETDGPLGALFLARALVPLGSRVALVSDGFCRRPLEVGLAACGLLGRVPVLTLPPAHAWPEFVRREWQGWCERHGLTHLVALERVGPSHTPESVAAQAGARPAAVESFRAGVPAGDWDRCHTMSGRDVTDAMSPAHLLFEDAARHRPGLTTVGIGDGGNEIGMGKVPWDVVCRNIPNGGRTACRVATDYLVVAGVSNWGAYGLAAGVLGLRGSSAAGELVDPAREHELLRRMVEGGPLVDGLTGRPSVTVDGLPFERYAEPLRWLRTTG